MMEKVALLMALVGLLMWAAQPGDHKRGRVPYGIYEMKGVMK